METQTKLLLAASALALTLASPNQVLASDLADDNNDLSSTTPVVGASNNEEAKIKPTSWNWTQTFTFGYFGGSTEEEKIIESPAQSSNDEFDDDQDSDEKQKNPKVQELEEQLELQKKELEKREAESQELQKKLDEQESQLSSLTTEKEEAVEAHQSAEKEIAENETQKKLDQEKLEELEKDTEKNKQAIEEHINKMKIQADLLKTLRKQEAEANLKAAQKEEALKKLRAQQDVTQSSLTEAKEKTKRLGQEIHQKDQLISKLNSELKEQKKKARELEAEKRSLKEKKERAEEEARKKQEQLQQLFGKDLTQSVFVAAKQAIADIADLGDTKDLTYQERNITLQKGSTVRLYDELMYFATNGNTTYIFDGESYKPKDLNKYLSGSVQNVLVRYENDTRFSSSGNTFRPNINYDIRSLHSDMVKVVKGTDVVSTIENSGLEFRGPYLMTPHQGNSSKKKSSKSK